MNKPPFKPTSCSCKSDQDNCKSQPGYLLPGQIAEILIYLGATIADAGKFFWNSPGMVLGNSVTGNTWRLRTITPRWSDGACVFFKKGTCTIHSVAPFGCRYFDIHMSIEEGQRRSMWGAKQVYDNDEYAKHRDALPMATHYKPRSAV